MMMPDQAKLNNDDSVDPESQESRETPEPKEVFFNYDQEFLKLKHEKNYIAHHSGLLDTILDHIQYKHLELRFKHTLIPILPNYLTLVSSAHGDNFYATLQYVISHLLPHRTTTQTQIQLSVLSYIKGLDKTENNWIKMEFAKEFTEVPRRRRNLTYQSKDNDLIYYLSHPDDNSGLETAFGNNSRISWDRLAIEARIICILYNIQLHFMVQLKNGLIEHYIVNESGKVQIQNHQIDYASTKLIHIAILNDNQNNSYYLAVLPQTCLTQLTPQQFFTNTPQINTTLSPENSVSPANQHRRKNEYPENTDAPEQPLDPGQQSFIDEFMHELNTKLSKRFLAIIVHHIEILRLNPYFIARIRKENPTNNRTREEYKYVYCETKDVAAFQQEIGQLKMFLKALCQTYLQQLMRILQQNSNALSALEKCLSEIKRALRMIANHFQYTLDEYSQECETQEQWLQLRFNEYAQTGGNDDYYWQQHLAQDFYLSQGEVQDLKDKMQSSYKDVYQYCKEDKFETFSIVLPPESNPRVGASQLRFVGRENSFIQLELIRSLIQINLNPDYFRGRYWYTNNANAMLHQMAANLWESLWSHTLNSIESTLPDNHIEYLVHNTLIKKSRELITIIFNALHNDGAARTHIEKCEDFAEQLTSFNTKISTRLRDSLPPDLSRLNYEQIMALYSLQHDGLTAEILRNRARLLKYSAQALTSLVKNEKIPVLTALSLVEQLNTYQRYGLAKELTMSEVRKIGNKQHVDTLINCKDLGLTADHLQNLNWFNSEHHQAALLYLLNCDKCMTIEQALKALSGMNPMQSKCVAQGIGCERVAVLTELQAETVSLLFDHGLHPEHLSGKKWFSNPYHRDVLVYLITKKQMAVNDALKVIDGTSWLQILDIVKTLCRPDLKITPEMLASPSTFWSKLPVVALIPTSLDSVEQLAALSIRRERRT